MLDEAERRGGHRPFVTFMDLDSGERTELGVAAAANWARKTANLLIEEFSAGPGALVGVVPFSHWTAPVIALGAWVAGAGLTTSEQASAWFAMEEDSPEVAARPLVLVGRGMGGRCTADPAAQGALFGYAETVLGFADHVDAAEWDPMAWALADAGEQTSHADLAAGADEQEGGRVLVEHPPFSRRWCATLLAALAHGGSLVMVRGGDGGGRERIAAQEHVTGIAG